MTPFFTSPPLISECVSPPQRTCSFGGFDLTSRSLHVVNSGTEADVSADRSRCLQRFPRSRPGPFRHADSHLFLLLMTDQRTRAHLQRGGQIPDYVSHLPGEEGQVGQGDHEEAHVQEVQQLLL